MLSSPNMKDINDRNLSFFSPQPFFIAGSLSSRSLREHINVIAGFFFPQQLFQLAWLYRLYKLSPNNPAERGELDQLVDFVPYYAVGNVCIGSKYS